MKVGRVRAKRWRAGQKRPSRMRQVRSYLLACSAILLTTQVAPAQQNPVPLPRNDYGSVGLIDMPSARMMPDGALTAGASFTRKIEHFNFGFQVTPWLETDFRYSGLQDYDPSFSVYYDRAFGAKVRLWDENGLIPAVALGANDLIGTGIYGGEYLVASKQFGTLDTTVGIGWGRLGSTNLFKNPLHVISKSLDTRPQTTGAAGATALNFYFHGPAGIFGGVVWQTPIEGLDLLAEYSSDTYPFETNNGTTRRQPTQLNFGVAYQWGDNLNLSLDYLYGDRVMGAFLLQFDAIHDSFPQRIGPSPVQPRIRSTEEQQQAITALLQGNAGAAQISSSGALVDALWTRDQSIDVRIDSGVLFLTTRNDAKNLCRDAADIAGRYVAHITMVNVSDGRQRLNCPVARSVAANPGVVAQTNTILAASPQSASVMTIDMRQSSPPDAKTLIAKLRADIAKQNITVNALDYDGSTITVYYTNYHYQSEEELIRRLTQLLMAEAPNEVEKFRMVSMSGNIPQRQFEVLRAPAERSISQTGALRLADAVTATPAPMNNPILAASEAGVFPRFSWAAYPQFRQQLFDPNNPFAVQFLATAGVSVELMHGLMIFGEGEINLYDNFNTARPAGSVLPHVRTDYLQFFTKGKNGIGQLDMEYRFRLSPEIFATARAGYLESMFAGVGGEVLWRPEGQRWAIGADVYDVQERAFDRLLGLQPYHVMTGHVSVYYASPWYDLNFQLRAGQYLAGDKGLTFAVTRRFSTGVEIGAFFTRTNVSAAQFGEGSFDKGFIIRIPVGWVTPLSTQAEISMTLRPVQRDGGQTLLSDATLYDETRRSSEAEMYLQAGQNP